MKDKEFYAGFDAAKKKEYEQYPVKYYGTIAEDLTLESKKRQRIGIKLIGKGCRKRGAFTRRLVNALIKDFVQKMIRFSR